jgi:hypothetical protein
LAEVAARETYGNSPGAIVDRLRDKFGDPTTRATYMELATTHDYVIETIEIQQLRELSQKLRKIGIEMELKEFERA